MDNGAGSASSNIQSINLPQGALGLRGSLFLKGLKGLVKVTWQILFGQVIIRSTHEGAPVFQIC
jgi:hypothetical protein